MSEKLLKGEVAITLDSRDKICIVLKDVVSGVKCVEIECDPADFANALMHRPSPCEFEWRPAHVGLKQEHKTEQVAFRATYIHHAQERVEEITKALKPFEVDGWKARHADVGNYRDRCKTKEGTTEEETYLVHFYRWVNIP